MCSILKDEVETITEKFLALSEHVSKLEKKHADTLAALKATQRREKILLESARHGVIALSIVANSHFFYSHYQTLNDGQNEALQATGFVKGEVDRWAELQELAMGNDELLANLEVWPSFQPGDDLSGYEVNPLFATDKSGFFHDISGIAGTDHKQVTRGIATSDFDMDGDLDLYVCSGGSEFEAQSAELQDRLYINDGRGNLFQSFSFPSFSWLALLSSFGFQAYLDYSLWALLPYPAGH